MRAIIKRIIYDTEKAELLFSFTEEKWPLTKLLLYDNKYPGEEPIPWPWRKHPRIKVDVYEGKNKNYFLVLHLDGAEKKLSPCWREKVWELCEKYCDTESEIAARLLGRLEEA